MKLDQTMRAQIKSWVTDDPTVARWHKDIATLETHKRRAKQEYRWAQYDLTVELGRAIRGIDWKLSVRERKEKSELFIRDNIKKNTKLFTTMFRKLRSIDVRIKRVEAKIGKRQGYLRASFIERFRNYAMIQRLT